MFAHYLPGSTVMRVLTNDDVSGLCSVYLPNGQRSVSPSTTPNASGLVDEEACDPTPRHGFSTQCTYAFQGSLRRFRRGGSRVRADSHSSR